MFDFFLYGLPVSHVGEMIGIGPMSGVDINPYIGITGFEAFKGGCLVFEIVEDNLVEIIGLWRRGDLWPSSQVAFHDDAAANLDFGNAVGAG